MLQLWKARRGRKAALSLIAPFIERSRLELGGIPDTAWSDAYLVGFLVMLASLEASDEAGTLKSYALGIVQSETLSKLSGQAADTVGEVICALSTEGSSCFSAGCRDAAAFHAALHQQTRDYPLPDVITDDARSGYPFELDADLYGLWKQLFESRVASLS
jgi:hypothetical protein